MMEKVKFAKDEDDQNESSNKDNGPTFVEFWETRKSGAQYRGEIHDETDRPNGRGIKIQEDKKAIYEGYWKDGKLNGYGRGINSAGEVYQGNFNKDQMDGDGFLCWPDGRIYEGKFEMGKRHGKGKFFWPNGQVYQGDFQEDLCHGSGILFYPDGKRYQGQFKKGDKNGKGAYIFPNGQMVDVMY